MSLLTYGRELVATYRNLAAGRRSKWLRVTYYAENRWSAALPKFDLVVPVWPDGSIDLYAWLFARGRALATRSDDTVQIGRLRHRAGDWVIAFEPDVGLDDLRVSKIAFEAAYDGYFVVAIRPEDEPPPPPPLEVRGPGWFVVRYASAKADSALPEFDLTVPADAQGQVDFDAWKADRDRTVATRPSDGAKVGLFLRAGHHWFITFEPGLGPDYMRLADKAGGERS